MKKALSYILVLILLVGLAVPAAAAGKPTLSISSGEVEAGESVTLTVSIEDNPGIAATLFYLYFDTSVFSSDPNKDVTAVGSFKDSGNLLANTTEIARKNGRYEGDPNKDGLIAVWFDAKNYSGNGDIVEITLHTEKEAPNGEYNVELVVADGKTGNEAAKVVKLIGSETTINLTDGSDQPLNTNREASSANDRLSDSIVLRIGSYGAVSYGELKAIDEDNHDVTPIINSNDRTLVPLRFIAENLGAAVYWDADLRQVTIEMAEKTVVMTIGSQSYTINGEEKQMDTAPEIVAGWGRTMVPIRFVAEALGMSVEWDAVNRLVLITPADRPWMLDGEAESEALGEVFQLMMLQSFL